MSNFNGHIGEYFAELLQRRFEVVHNFLRDDLRRRQVVRIRQRIVARHGGTIGIESELGRGTVVTLTLEAGELHD